MFAEESGSLTNRRASDANYDPVQMDMSEESNNNNTSDDSSSERGNNSPPNRRDSNIPKRDSPARSPPLRHSESEKNTQEDSKRGDRYGKGKQSTERSRKSSHDERRRDYKDSKDYRKSRDDDRRSRDNDRRRDKDRVSSSRDERDRSHRDDRRDRDRDRDRDHGREKRRDRDRERDHRRRSRDDRSKDRHRDEKSTSHHKESERTRSRSRSRERNQSNYNRSMSYREEKNRSKLAQLEKLGIELKTPENESGVINPQEQHFYNPLTTATQGKYAEQIQKRKLLWAHKKPDESKTSTTTTTTSNTWVGTTFTHDQDGKVTAKFKRLMGIKGDSPANTNTEGSKPDILKKQEEMFTNMEQQYEVARATTHTQRGVGLGYATGGYQFPR
ncbi:pre-mRNA-splicing factor 38B isoform X2 [Leptopilina heterotoma]|nr:pre-mRNA-splicing factor 38B isoform X2 [Leptopilina heterotoma]